MQETTLTLGARARTWARARDTHTQTVLPTVAVAAAGSRSIDTPFTPLPSHIEEVAAVLPHAVCPRKFIVRATVGAFDPGLAEQQNPKQPLDEEKEADRHDRAQDQTAVELLLGSLKAEALAEQRRRMRAECWLADRIRPSSGLTVGHCDHRVAVGCGWFVIKLDDVCYHELSFIVLRPRNTELDTLGRLLLLFAPKNHLDLFTRRQLDLLLHAPRLGFFLLSLPGNREKHIFKRAHAHLNLRNAKLVLRHSVALRRIPPENHRWMKEHYQPTSPGAAPARQKTRQVLRRRRAH